MQVPVPGAADEGGLGLYIVISTGVWIDLLGGGRKTYVERVVPAPDAELQPPLCVHGAFERPRPPRVVVFLTQLLVGDLVPHAAAIGTHLHPLRPAASAVRPARETDLSIMNDNIVVDRRHDRTRDRHGLDTKPIAVGHVLLPQLRGVVEILLHLHGRHGRGGDDIDAGEPLAAAGADVAHDHHPQRETMDRREGFAVHLPREQHLVDLDFADRHRDGVVVHLPLFEVRVCAEELDVRAFVLQPAVFQHLFEGDARPARGPDCALAPRRVDELVAVAGVLGYLLDAAGAAALEGDDSGLAGEDGLVLEGGEGDLLGGVDEAFDFEEVLVGVDFGDAAVVADEEVGVFGDFGLGLLVFRRERTGEVRRADTRRFCLNVS